MAEQEIEDLDPLDPEDVAAHQAIQQVRQDQNAATLEQMLRDRRDAYMRFFGGVGMSGDRRLVMEDLRRFCRGDTSAFHENERIHTLLTGRQEVWLRIKDHLELDFDDLLARYSKQ